MASNIGTHVEQLIENFQNTLWMTQSLGRLVTHLDATADMRDVCNLFEWFGDLQADQFDQLADLLKREIIPFAKDMRNARHV
jgi:hypothetical protein